MLVCPLHMCDANTFWSTAAPATRGAAAAGGASLQLGLDGTSEETARVSWVGTCVVSVGAGAFFFLGSAFAGAATSLYVALARS